MTVSAPAPQHNSANARWPVLVRLVVLAGVVALATYVAVRLAQHGHPYAIVGTAFVAMAILVIYGTRKRVPMKYLLPGLLLLLALQVWPIVYTAATSVTNYGQGHLTSKVQATEQDIAYSVQQVPGSPTYALTIAVKHGQSVDHGKLYFLLAGPRGKLFVGSAKGLTPLSPNGVRLSGGKIISAPGYVPLTLRQANQRKDLSSFAVPTKQGGIKASGFTSAYEGRPTLVWDKAADTITDSRTKQVYVARNAHWVPRNGHGEPLPVGWKENVGLANFKAVFTNQTLRSGFLRVFVWNIAFAVGSVLTTFVLGMLLALLLNDSRIRGRGIYRSLLILPYALPVFVSALVWASMFNQQFGLINAITHTHIDWLGNAWAARGAILLTNLWLGFPYMFVVCTGALQSIPTDVLEAARIDGANALRTLTSVTVPLLLVAVGPLLIASFAFNFNNFGLIYLITQGGPFNGGNVQIGSTDLLITMAYRLAINGTSPNFGMASAVAVIIFILVALMSFPGFLRSKALEEVHG